MNNVEIGTYGLGSTLCARRLSPLGNVYVCNIPGNRFFHITVIMPLISGVYNQTTRIDGNLGNPTFPYGIPVEPNVPL